MTQAALNRLVFTTSRLAEFCSERELINQTGHDSDDWPLVILKELVDNALDACEEADIAPVIEIVVSDDGIAVTDNGPGIAPDVVANIIDYTSRTSSREAYCSPTRGAQGNALKTVITMGFALDGERGETLVESRGIAHRITFSIDSIRQVPRIGRICEASLVKNATRVAVSWPVSPSSILDDAEEDFLRIAEDYTWVNPHLTLTVVGDRAECNPVQWTIPATDPAWRKWRPSDPTSPHWYDKARLARLIANNIAYAQDHGMPCRTVWDFVREFRGLSATVSLAEFYGDGEEARVAALLGAMRKQSRPIKPRDLGIIGEAHLRAKFQSAGAAPERIAADGPRPIDAGDDPPLIDIIWAIAEGRLGEIRDSVVFDFGFLVVEALRRLGDLGQSLDAILTKQRAGPSEPIIAVLHLACPRIE